MTAKLSHIFLDMDGVLCQWYETAVIQMRGTPIGETFGQIPYYADKFMGVERAALEVMIDSKELEFWKTLPHYPWATALCHALDATQVPLTILSSPGHYPHGASGKFLWLQTNFYLAMPDFIFTKHKHLCAAPGRLLIDDSEEMVDAFRDHGGHAILFPQRWNARWKEASSPLGPVLAELKELLA